MLLKRVYYGCISHRLSNRCCLLSEEFSGLPSHWLGQMPDAPALGRAAQECRGGGRICLGNRQGVRVAGHGGGGRGHGKMQTSAGQTDADTLPLLRGRPGLETQPQGWNQTDQGSNPKCATSVSELNTLLL